MSNRGTGYLYFVWLAIMGATAGVLHLLDRKANALNRDLRCVIFFGVLCMAVTASMVLWYRARTKGNRVDSSLFLARAVVILLVLLAALLACIGIL